MKRALLLFSMACASACSPSIDLTKGVQVEELSTGWLDAGVVDGKNKVVPAVSFKLKNVSSQALKTLQVNAVFRRASQDEEWGSGFRTVAGSGGLAPGAASDTLIIKADLGYTGTDSRDAMLKHSQFVDAKVDLFAKYGSTQWARIGAFPVIRQLMEGTVKTSSSSVP